jgi:hypothetical protein
MIGQLKRVETILLLSLFAYIFVLRLSSGAIYRALPMPEPCQGSVRTKILFSDEGDRSYVEVTKQPLHDVYATRCGESANLYFAKRQGQ